MSLHASKSTWHSPPVAETPNLGVIEENMSYDERLFHYTYATRYDDVHFMEYRILHRLNIFHLQNKLAKLKGVCWTDHKLSDEKLTEMKTTLHEYITAIKDYEYIRSLPTIENSPASSRRRDLTHSFPEIAELSGDPFNSRYCGLISAPEIPPDPIRIYLKTILPRRLTYTKAEMDVRIDNYLAGLPPQTISPFVDKLARFAVAFAGGACLLVPMLVMCLPSIDRTKSLITVSVAVMFFVFMMSIGIQASNAETVVATATYAAVLVVFVGTSS